MLFAWLKRRRLAKKQAARLATLKEQTNTLTELPETLGSMYGYPGSSPRGIAPAIGRQPEPRRPVMASHMGLPRVERAADRVPDNSNDLVNAVLLNELLTDTQEDTRRYTEPVRHEPAPARCEPEPETRRDYSSSSSCSSSHSHRSYDSDSYSSSSYSSSDSSSSYSSSDSSSSSSSDW